MAAIIGLGTASANVVDQASAMEHAASRNCSTPRQKRVLERAYRIAGLDSRSTVLGYHDVITAEEFLPNPVGDDAANGPTTAQRMRLYAETVSSLALRASRSAIADAAISIERITHVITITCTGFYAPGFDIELIEKLNLPRDVARTQIGFMGCHAALNGLRVARAIVDSDPEACVLLCSSEVCSLHFQYGWDSENIVANAIFADGAAAAIVARDDASKLQLKGSGAYIVPDSKAAMTWNIGDYGFSMTLSPEVPRIINEFLPSFCERWLKDFALHPREVVSWAVHPGGPRILSAAQNALQLTDEQIEPSRSIFARLGNMSSPTLLFVLEAMRQKRSQLPIVMLGFGPGLAIEAALIG